MYHKIVSVLPQKNYHLKLSFDNNEERIFDVAPYFSYGKFSELKNEKLFNTVHKKFDSIEWDNQLDLDPVLLYEKSIPV